MVADVGAFNKLGLRHRLRYRYRWSTNGRRSLRLRETPIAQSELRNSCDLQSAESLDGYKSAKHRSESVVYLPVDWSQG
jgi:hypothetical protein